MTSHQITIRSGNRKTGPISTVIVDNKTCPDACPLKANGCYAEYSHVGALWQAISGAKPGDSIKHGKASIRVHSLSDLCRAIVDDFTRLWRYGVAGDLPGKGDRIDRRKLSLIVSANAVARKLGFAYTHKPMTSKANREAIKDAIANGFTINLSGNNPKHADELADLGIAPVVTILPEHQTENTTTPKGRTIVVCPAVTQGLTCLECKLCARANRTTIIGFPAHGAGKARASEVAA